MCGINVAVNGSLKDVELMHKATKNRGLKNSTFYYENFIVSFDLLPITDENAPNQPFCYESHLVWMNGYISNYKELAKRFNW